MRSHSYTSLSDVSNLLSSSYICVGYKDIQKETLGDEIEDFEENTCDFDEVEEVFADHMLMGKRLRKTLYAGSFCDLDEPPDHPPIALTGLALELFSKAVPNDGLDMLDMDYVSSASEAARISPCAMIVAMIYLERLQMNKSEYLEVVSPSGLFVVTMLVASKFLFEDEEDIVTNQMWAEALNFDVKELNDLERDFLAAIDWKVFIDSSDYFNYLCSIEKIIAAKQSSLRDWLSYSDICAMLHDAAFQNFWTSCFKQIAKAMLLWTVGYVATALALHNAGITLYKLKHGKQELQVLSENNTTVESQNHINSMIKSLYLPVESSPNIDENNFGEYIGVEKFNEQLAENHNSYPRVVNQHMCNSYVSKRTSLSSLNLSEILLLDKLKTSIDLYSTHKLILVNNSYSCNRARSRPSFGCFTLLM